ncbi:PD-(D/E)XK nuclease-like domain-containing protein [Mesorhizobium amorphae]|uniref:PD-(D/E)XK nuclease-like domain-containing protein n=1 Tax=Mesorhizobium amorphae TaxID=71433 RepID=UPI001182C93C|nr:PD-(D/E)XK nuclease-like domain-containing protein [Mesorhizobium amorphae]
MNTHVDIDRDAFRSIGTLAGNLVKSFRTERVWDGSPITEPGIYSGISLDDYHGNRDLLDGPSVSKSMLKWLVPAHGGSPKAFWGRWKWNPNHVSPPSSKALDFGKATHCLLLGDEVFEKQFVVRPETYPDAKTGEFKPWNGNSKVCQEWLETNTKGRTVLTRDDIALIERMRADAAQHPLIQGGILNGRIERSMFWKDQKTGIWLKARPDAIPRADGVFADLKTAASFDEDFLEKQIFDACYYLQAAITRMVCRGIELPFDTFALLYVLKDDVPDTTHAEVSVREIDRGEQVVRWSLDKIRECLDSGEWPGARPFNDGTRHIQMKEWQKSRVDRFLEQEAA